LAATRVTHALVGFSKVLLADFDRLLPAGSVMVLEDPEVVEARDVRRRLSSHPSAAFLREGPIQDEADTAGLLRTAGERGHIVAVVPGVEYGVVAAAVLASTWGLPGAGLRAARIFTDKAVLREHADAAGLPQPRWQIAAGPGDIAAFRAARGRCVLKPANRQASLGVRVLADDDDPVTAWTETVSVQEKRQRARRSPRVRHLVEKYLAGPEVSAECLVDDGTVVFINITAKRVNRGTWPVELGHVVPAPLPSAVTDRIATLMARLVITSGFGTGVLHAEWILVDGTKPHLVECAARLPGDSIADLIDLVYGGSMAGDLVGLLSGSGTPRRARLGVPAGGAAIRFLTCPPGVVRYIGGIDLADGTHGVREVTVTVAVDATVAPLRSSWDRIGHVVAVGPTGQDAEARAAHAAALITIGLQ
jgi:biotin carboxylase